MSAWVRRSITLLGVAAGAIAVLGPTADAGTVTGGFAVQTMITADCTLATNALSFNYQFSRPALSSTVFTITCPAAAPSDPQSVYFTFTPVGGAYELRQGNSVLSYQLCFDSACAYPYPPNGTQAAGTTINLTTSPYSYVLFGQIPAGQNGVGGSVYSQNVTATLNY